MEFEPRRAVPETFESKLATDDFIMELIAERLRHLDLSHIQPMSREEREAFLQQEQARLESLGQVRYFDGFGNEISMGEFISLMLH